MNKHIVCDEEESSCNRIYREPGKVKAGDDRTAGMALEHPR